MVSSKNVTFGGMPSLTTSTGGASTGIISRIKNAIPSFSLKTVGIIVLIVVLGLISFFIYKNYIESAKNPSYKANRENIPIGSQAANDSGNGKDAEILLFYTDWCPHCKTAKPEWEQVKAEYDGKQIHGYNIIFTEVNCTNKSPDLESMLNTYKIDGYPTIKLVKDNQIIDYDAKPIKATLIQFLNTVV